MMTHEVEATVDTRCLLGECPVWLPDPAELLIVDLLEGECTALATARDAGDGRAGDVRQCRGAVEANRPDNRANDGKCGSAGRSHCVVEHSSDGKETR
jgi:sugar lactone lactonase YvrE